MQAPKIEYPRARFYFQKGIYCACALLRKLGMRVPMGNQNIPCFQREESFPDHLKKTYDHFRTCYDGKAYDKGRFKYCDSFGSMSHYVFSILSFYNCNRVYEIGTYFGCMTMMMVNYFHERGGDFSIETIDVKPRFDLKSFRNETVNAFHSHEQKVQFHIGDSKQHKPSRPYDLVILDGSHLPNDVWQDFWQVKDYAKYILFDDLHMYSNYEVVYKKIIATPGIEEVFRVYTSDCNGHDPHCLALVRVHQEQSQAL